MEVFTVCAIAVTAFIGGVICGRFFRHSKKAESTPEAPPREDEQAESLRKQWENIMSYTGRDQID